MGKRGLLTASAAIAVILLTLVPFWIDVRSTLEMVALTKYPGARRSSGGDVSLFKLLSGWVNFFQTTRTIPSVYNNICEASNFYILWPTTLFLVIVARLRRISRISPLILSLAVFIICLSAYCVLPMPNVLLRATLLNLVTERRALLSIGIANILLCSFFLDRYPGTILRKRSAIIAGILWSCAIIALIWKAGLDNPMMFPSRSQILIASICSVIVAVVFIFGKKTVWSLAILVVLLVATNIRVNPVMSGLGPLLRSQAFQKIDSIRLSDPNAKWIVYYEFIVPELIVATGAKVLNGNKILPDFDFLHRLDPSGGGDRIYNRYSYIYCEIPKGLTEPSVSQISDTIYVLYLWPNLPVLEDIGCRFVLFPDSRAESELYGFARVYENEKNGIFVYKRL
jgi:hypothetical protein